MNELYKGQSEMNHITDMHPVLLSYLPSAKPKAWLSRRRIENFDLTPTQACVLISHDWLKFLSLYSINCLILKYINYLKKLEPNLEKTWTLVHVNDWLSPNSPINF